MREEKPLEGGYLIFGCDSGTKQTETNCDRLRYTFINLLLSQGKHHYYRFNENYRVYFVKTGNEYEKTSLYRFWNNLGIKIKENKAKDYKVNSIIDIWIDNDETIFINYDTKYLLKSRMIRERNAGTFDDLLELLNWDYELNNLLSDIVEEETTKENKNGI